MIYNYKELVGYKESLIESFIQVDELFLPPLLKRIASNNKDFTVEEYINKLNKNGDIFLFVENETIMGFVAVYTNDAKFNTAYIPLLFVLPKYEGRGIATMLLSQIKEHSILKSMKFIRVNTWIENKVAIFLYNHNGYKIINIENSNVQLMMEL